MAKGGKTIAHVVAVNMGYGHERPARVLQHLAGREGVIIANDYEGIPERDRRIWEESRHFYEKISRFKKVPVIGPLAFKAFDELQKIPDFYPRRDLSSASLNLIEYYALFRRLNWNKALIDQLAENPVPLVTTFPIVGFAAEEFHYPNDIWVLCTDADIGRHWAPRKPQQSQIKYLAPNGRVKERLMLYGVQEENIELTGFPLPKGSIGGATPKVLHKNLSRRICNLDPKGIFLSRSMKTIEAHMGASYCKGIERKKVEPVHVVFAVGGAGAQKEIGIEIAKSLRYAISQNRIRLTLVAGSRPEVATYFEQSLLELGMEKELKKKSPGIKIFFEEDRALYFDRFSDLMNETDILWTKPSELSFYAGLGLPIIMCPTVGSQEDFNRKWLYQMAAGMDQFDARYTHEWLFDWIDSGALARMAWNGYMEAPTHGTYRIEDVVMGRPNTIHPLPLVV